MLALLRRDPVMGSNALRFGAILAANVGVMTGLVTTLAAASNTLVLGYFGSLALLALLIWPVIAIFLTFGKAWDRCRPLELALPISGRRLWLSHVVALVVLGIVFLVLAGSCLEILFWAFSRTALNFFQLKQALADLAVPTGVCLVLAVVLLQSLKPSQCRVHTGHTGVLFWIATTISGLALIPTLAVLPPLTALVPFVFALGIGFRTYRSVPPAFMLNPIDAFPTGTAVASGHIGADADRIDTQAWTGIEAGYARGMRFGWFLFRLLYGKPAFSAYMFLGFYPLLILLGVIFSGFMAVWQDLELPQLTWLFLAAYLLVSSLPAQIMQLHLILALPISRKRVFACLALPGLLAMSFGYGAGNSGTALMQSSRLMVRFQKESSSLLPAYPLPYPMVRVPAQYFEVAWNGQVPDNGSPWGESHTAWQDPLYRGSRIRVYSPFSTPKDSSPRFVALQISKAIQAVYGAAVPHEQVRDRYLEVKDNLGVGLKDGGALLLRDYPNLKLRGEIPLFPVLMLVIGGTWLLMAALYFRACRARVSDAGRKVVYYGMLAFALAVNIAPVPLTITGISRLEVGEAFTRVLIRNTTASLPGGTAVVWVICALLLFGAYRLANTQFKRIELLPGRPCR